MISSPATLIVESLDKRSSCLVMFAFEIIPLRLYGIVGGQLRITLGIFNTQADIYGNKVVKQQCVDTLILILRQHTG